MTTTTDCPDAELCARLGKHIHGRLLQIWRGENIDPVMAAQYRAKWEVEALGGTIPLMVTTTVPTNQAAWPLLARMVAMAKADGDTGLGDTIARNLGRFGADAMKRLYRRITGADCGCGDRQRTLNIKYPY